MSADDTGHILTVAQLRLLVARGRAILTKYDEELDGPDKKLA